MMQSLTPIDPIHAEGKTREIYEQVVKIMGRVPLMMQLMANSEAAAEAYLQFNLALSRATLPASTRTLIQAAVAEADDCDYSRLIARGQAANAGVAPETLAQAARGNSSDPRIQAALRFAVRVVEHRGRPAPADVVALRAAGYGDEEFVEIIATIVLGLFRNYFNLVAGTEVDAVAPRATQ